MATWLDPSFPAPTRLELATSHHLRQIREDDVDLDYAAVMGSQERLWQTFGPAWGWPPATMTKRADRADLRRHAEEMQRNESFNYAVFDADETALLGCVYIDPPDRVGADADISWWVVDDEVDGPLDRALAIEVPTWIAAEWPFEDPRFIGLDLSWQEWLALPEHGDTTASSDARDGLTTSDQESAAGAEPVVGTTAPEEAVTEAATCTVIVTVDASRHVLAEMAQHATVGLTLFPGFDGFVAGHLRVSEDETRLVQHLEWTSREAYLRCRDDESWEALPSTEVFMRHVETGAATVDARVFGLVASHVAHE